MTLTILLVSVSVLLILALNLLTWLWVEYKRWKIFSKIPGPPGNIILGNQLELRTSPEKVFKIQAKRCQDYFPIFRSWAGLIHVVNLVSPEDMEILLTNNKNISKTLVYTFLHGWLGTGLLTSTGTKWQTRRKILTPAFHFNILQEFVTIFNEETKTLVEILMEKDENAPVDVVPLITQFTLQSIGETAMGTKLTLDTEEKILYKDAVLKFGQLILHRATRPWLIVPLFYKLSGKHNEEKQLIKTLHSFSNNVISERKKKYLNKDASYSTKKKLAMLDLLLAYKENGADIDDEGIREEVDTFMFEGHDTTSVAICYALMILANNREVQDNIFQELNEILGTSTNPPTYTELQSMCYLERCLKEVLRMYPSVPIIGRRIAEGFNTATGYTVQKGDIVLMHIYHMHHSPKIYPDPEKFDPDRFLPEAAQKRHPFAYVPFSAGPRNCIGQKFAMLELKAVMCGILKNFILEPVDGPEDMVYLADMVLRPEGEIKVKFVKR